MKRLIVLAGLGARLARSGCRRRPSARQLHGQPLQRVQPSGDRIYVLYVLDMAEIPTFQAKDERAAGRGAYAASLVTTVRDGLTLSVGGRPLAFDELRHRIVFPAGAGGLETTRLEIVFESGPVRRAGALAYGDDSFAGKLGWREIVRPGRRRQDRRSERPGRDRHGRVEGLPAGPALEPAGRPRGHRRAHAGRGRGARAVPRRAAGAAPASRFLGLEGGFSSLSPGKT